jgi:hypothetical protein
LELGASHGRDTTFFSSNGIEVEALDYSLIAVNILDKIRREKRLPIKPRVAIKIESSNHVIFVILNLV